MACRLQESCWPLICAACYAAVQLHRLLPSLTCIGQQHAQSVFPCTGIAAATAPCMPRLAACVSRLC